VKPRTWWHNSDFLRHNIIFFAGSIAVGALNYLYYPIVGHLLTPAVFGEVQTLISLFLQVTIFLSVLGLVTIHIVANYSSDNRKNAVVLEFEKLALYIAIGLLIVTALFQNQLKHFLQFTSPLPFVLLMCALIVSVPFTFRGAYLRGKQRFGLASAVNIIGAGSKIVLSVAFIMLGAGTAGTIGGLVAAQAVASLFAIVWARRNGLFHPDGKLLWQPPNVSLLKPELPYGLLVLTGSLIVTMQYSIDVVVVKHFFDPHTAGLYAGMASVARIIFFVTASVASVLIPMVRVDAPAGHNRRLLVKSLILLAATGVPVLIVFTIAPQPVMSLLMGPAYKSTASLLPLMSAGIFIVSVINLIVSYYMALRRYTVAPVIIIGASVTYVLLALHHGSLRAIVTSLVIGGLVMLLILIGWAARTRTMK